MRRTKPTAIAAAVVVMAVFGGPLWSQNTVNLKVMDEIKDAFIGRGLAREAPSPGEVVSRQRTGFERTFQEDAVPPANSSAAGTAKKIFGFPDSFSTVIGTDAKGSSIAVAAYNTKIKDLVKSAKQVDWQKVRDMAERYPDSDKLIILTNPNQVFKVGDRAYMLNADLAVSYVMDKRRATLSFANTAAAGPKERAYITVDGYICRVKRLTGEQ